MELLRTTQQATKHVSEKSWDPQSPKPPHPDPYPREIDAILRIWQLKAKKPWGSEARAEPNTWT